MFTQKDRRQDKRVYPLREIYTVKYGIEMEIGFIADISQSGLKLILDTQEVKNLGSLFTIRIRLPKKLRADFVDISVHQSWKTNEPISGYQEIGCYYDNISPDQQDSINQLLELYKNLRSSDIKEC